MKIFIDTNVFLTFYHFSSEDLEELNKLSVLLGGGAAELYLPTQVRDELVRNRAAKIADALKNFNSRNLDLKFPQIAKGYPEYAQARAAMKGATEILGRLQTKLSADISANTLSADKTIAALFAKATKIAAKPSVFESARRRVALGNPPGKNGSLGDALNWETLLDFVQEGEDLFVVSGDGDFQSPLESENFNEFLSDEWYRRKKATVYYYTRISAFFKENFPQVKLATQLEKDLLTHQLLNATSFALAKSILRRLSRFTDLTDAEVNAIADASTTNNQVYLIMTDDDVEPYFRDLLQNHEGVIDETILRRLKFRLGDIALRESDPQYLDLD